MSVCRYLNIKVSLLLFAVFGSQQATGAQTLKFERIQAPVYVLAGDSAELHCHYNLGTEKLYSITWYKDHEEFYRFVPKDKPSQHVYRLDGARFDRHRSDDRRITLRDVDVRATGIYRCEVSAEAPSFTSVHGDAIMEVIVLPMEDPEIVGDSQELYRFGDVISFNCTSAESYPPANLKWYVNDIQIDAEYKAIAEKDFLASTTSGITITVRDFRTSVRCEAVVSPSITSPGQKPHSPLDIREAVILVQSWSRMLQSSWRVVSLNFLVVLLMSTH